MVETGGFTQAAAGLGASNAAASKPLQQPAAHLRIPAEVIKHAVRLHRCFSLSLRDVETILAARHCGQLREHPRLSLTRKKREIVGLVWPRIAPALLPALFKSAVGRQL